MVFCNPKFFIGAINALLSHNPYFNRWFSAISACNTITDFKLCHNPYFNRWFSAIILWGGNVLPLMGHNPYFNRWFSAI